MIKGTDLDRPVNLRKVLPSRGTKRFIPCVPGVHSFFSLLIHWKGSSLCSVRMKHVSLSPRPPPHQPSDEHLCSVHRGNDPKTPPWAQELKLLLKYILLRVEGNDNNTRNTRMEGRLDRENGFSPPAPPSAHLPSTFVNFLFSQMREKVTSKK